MRGKYRVTVQNKKIKYDFTLKRNITIIRGDSATGKTALVDMIREYYENGTDSGIELNCEKVCAVLEGKNWKAELTLLQECIVFIDEGNSFVASTEFAKELQNSSNYFVIVTRESLSSLPYAVSEIYGIRNSGKYGRLQQTYNEMYQIYDLESIVNEIKPEIVITEDSNAGYQFFTDICEKSDLSCISAQGKSNIFQIIKGKKKLRILVIADGAAFGPEMEKIMKLSQQQRNITLYLPESFEWLVLKSEVVNDKEIEEALKGPWEVIESQEYMSWERFFTHLLVNKTENTYLQYSKRSLNPAYLQTNIQKKIMNVIEKINFEWKK